MSLNSWFDALSVVGQSEHYSWIAGLPIPVESVVNFGCWSGCEPFALMWTLDAHEIMVVEMEGKFLDDFNEQMEILAKLHPQSIRNREIDSLNRDMKVHIPELKDEHYDMAYCEDVLYALPIQGGEEAVGRAIRQMARTVKPDGFVVAVEPKFGAEFETRRSESLGIDLSLPVPVTDPEDMSELFAIEGLVEIRIPDCPPYAYCYRKRS